MFKLELQSATQIDSNLMNTVFTWRSGNLSLKFLGGCTYVNSLKFYIKHVEFSKFSFEIVHSHFCVISLLKV